MAPVTTARSTRVATAIAAVFLMVALSFAPAVALAAEPVTDLDVLSVGFLGSPEQQILIIAGQVADTVKLPAVIELGVPEGSKIDWMGELSGGETTEADIASDYTLDRTENGYDIYRATITKFRRFQIEGQIPTVFIAGADGAMTAAVKYVPTNNATMALIGAEVPTGYSPTDATGLSQLGGGINGTVWGKTLNNVTAGTEMAVTVSYASAPTSGTAGGATSSSGTVWLVLALVMTALFGVLIFYVTNRRMGTEYSGK